MDGNYRLVDVLDVLLQMTNDAGIVRRNGVAHRVGNVDGGGSGVDGRCDHFGEEIEFGTGGIFGRKLHIVAVAFGSLHFGNRATNDLVFPHFQLKFPMNGTGGQKHMDAGLLGILQSFPGAVDVFGVGPCQAADHSPAHLLGDFANGFKIAGRSDGETGFNDVHAKIHQGVGNFNFFRRVHAGPGRLLAVAERGIEDHNLFRVVHDMSSFLQFV